MLNGMKSWRKVRWRERAYYEPEADGVERLPTALSMFHASPAGHADAALACAGRGQLHRPRLGALPHERPRNYASMPGTWRCSGAACRISSYDSSDDLIYAGGHLPLVHFFRLRLPQDVQSKLMQGATLVTQRDRRFRRPQFRALERLCALWRPDEGQHRGRRAAAAHRAHAVRPLRAAAGPAALRQAPSRASTIIPRPSWSRICDFIADNFREDIDSSDIAQAADIHPKYAMNVFKKIDRHDAQRLCQPDAPELCAGPADAGRGQCAAGGHG